MGKKEQRRWLLKCHLLRWNYSANRDSSEILLYKVRSETQVQTQTKRCMCGPPSARKADSVFASSKDAWMQLPMLAYLRRHTMIGKLYSNGHRFIQDNDPKHTFAKAWQFFIDHGVNWWHTPPESPDCNPIENMWHEMKEHLRWEVNQWSKEELAERILSVWETVDSAKCCRYINQVNLH